MAALVFAVSSMLTVNIAVSASYVAFATAAANLWNHLLLSYALGRISRALSARPENAISPDSELMAKYGGLLRATPIPGVTGEPHIELFEGFDPANLEVEWLAGVGDCMEPDYPGGRTLYCFDTSLPVRSGDLVIVRHQPPPKFKANRFVASEPQDLVKWAQQCGDHWVLYSIQDEPFVLDSTMRFRGRVVATMVMPEGLTYGCASAAAGIPSECLRTANDD